MTVLQCMHDKQVILGLRPLPHLILLVIVNERALRVSASDFVFVSIVSALFSLRIEITVGLIHCMLHIQLRGLRGELVCVFVQYEGVFYLPVST